MSGLKPRAGRSRSYPAVLMREAQDLFEAGWTVNQIHRQFVRRRMQRCPSRTVLYYWVDPAAAAAHRARQRERMRRRGAAAAAFRLPSSTPEYLAGFAEQLRGEGVPVTSTAKVLTVVTGERWTRERAAKLLQGAYATPTAAAAVRSRTPASTREEA